MFAEAIPDEVEEFSAYIYAIVDRKPDKVVRDALYGDKVRLNPCVFDWNTKTITMHIPSDINEGINSFDDLDPSFYEAVEAAFVVFMRSCL